MENEKHLNDHFIDLLRSILGPAEWYESSYTLFIFLIIVFAIGMSRSYSKNKPSDKKEKANNKNIFTMTEAERKLVGRKNIKQEFNVVVWFAILGGAYIAYRFISE